MPPDSVHRHSDLQYRHAPARQVLASSRDKIIAVATQLFADRGCNGTSMREIAKSAGMLPGSLYAHIVSKEALINEIIEKSIDNLTLAIAEVEAKHYPPSVALREAIRAHVTAVADDPERARIVSQQWRFIQGANGVSLNNKLARYVDFFRRTLLRGTETGVFSERVDPTAKLRLVLAVLAWAPDWLSAIGRERSDEVAEQIIEALTSGLYTRVTPEPELTVNTRTSPERPPQAYARIVRGSAEPLGLSTLSTRTCVRRHPSHPAPDGSPRST